MDRKEVIDLLSKKLNGDLKISYDHLAVLTNYSKRQLIRLSKSLNEKGIDSIFGIMKGVTSIEEALEKGKENIEKTSENVIRLMKLI